MALYSAADAARLLGIKVHVIRYWEKEVPLIQSKKTVLGKRFYSDRDMQILIRLKHLLYNRHFTVEGAREELIREVSGGGEQDLRAGISAIRSQLMELYFLAGEHTAPPGDDES